MRDVVKCRPIESLSGPRAAVIVGRSVDGDALERMAQCFWPLNQSLAMHFDG
jgi:hypothetical protein